MIITEALGAFICCSNGRPSSTPTGAPAMLRNPPKLVCTSAPTIEPFANLRDAVPIPPFNPNATVPVPRSYGAFLHQAALSHCEWRRTLHRGEHFIAANMAATDIVQITVIGFAHQRVDGLHRFIAGQCQHVIDDGILHAPDV